MILSLNQAFLLFTQSHHRILKHERKYAKLFWAVRLEYGAEFPLLLNTQKDTSPKGFLKSFLVHWYGSFLQQGLSPVEAPSWSMGQRKDRWVCQLPYSSFSQFLTGTKPQVWNLSDHLYKVLGVLRWQALKLTGTCFKGRCMGHNQDVISFTFTFTYYFFCYLETSTDVSVIGFWNH